MDDKYNGLLLNGGYTWEQIDGHYQDSLHDMYCEALGLPKTADVPTIRQKYITTRQAATKEWQKLVAKDLGLPENASLGMIQTALAQKEEQENNMSL